MRVCLAEGHDRSGECDDPERCWCDSDVIEQDDINKEIALAHERLAFLHRRLDDLR